MAEGFGLIRVATPAEVAEAERAGIAISKQKNEAPFFSDLAAHIRANFEDARDHRQSEGIYDALLHSLRTYRGEYSAEKKREIALFSGSQVYARVTAVKCRGASALLRDIFLSSERPWTINPSPEPTLPGNVVQNVITLVNTEAQTLAQGGQPADPQVVQNRINSLLDAARKAEKKKAKKQAELATSKVDDVLSEGGFYKALSEILIDLPIFLFGAIKGPVVRRNTSFRWLPNGEKEVVEQPKMFWERVSPFDLWFSPSASSVEKSSVYERIRLTRDDLHDLIGIGNYNEEAIRNVLNYMRDPSSGGFREWLNYFESERAELENREDPRFTQEQLYVEVLEYNGYVRGQWLIDWGLKEKDVPDPDREYFATVWLVHDEVLKVQLNPNPKQRPNYYITCFEKIPGSIYGNGLPQILSDIQDVVNATLRALVNNLAIASGPQVVIDDDRAAPGMDTDTLYPWKRWHTVSDPLSTNQPPVTFYQPQSNAQELLSVYKEFTNIADEVSAIPRYLTGSQRTGGAAATASGLSMLMNNASKVMQSVAANIDEDIISPVIHTLYDILMLSDEEGTLRGDEQIVVRGVTNAIQREMDRVRQLEFLNITANPIDAQIIGVKGRSSVLRAVAKNLGLEGYGEDVVPDEEVLQALQEQMMAGQVPGATGQQGSNPQSARSDSAPPRMDAVSNVSSV